MAASAVGQLAPVCCAALATFLVAGPVMGQSASADLPPQGLVVPVPGGILIRLAQPPQPKPKTDAVVLSAEQYKQLLDRLEKLQAQVDAQRPMRPRSCELDGKLETHGRQPVVRLRVTFKFSTTRPNTLVHLGCQKAHAVEAHSDDGKAPLLTAGDDGLRVLAESAGDHTIRLDLDVPLTARGPKGAEMGFEVGLPGAPITALTFVPPANVHRYHLTTKTSRPADAGPGVPETETEQPEAERFLPGQGGDPLGPITSLALSWEDPGRKANAVRSVETEITATVAANELITEAKLHLHGAASEWKFTGPASADVTVGVWPRPGEGKATEFPPDRAPNVLRPDPGQSVWRIVFREPFASDLLVTVMTRQPRSRANEAAGRGPFPIGPFAVLGVPQQSGTIRLRSPSNWRPIAALKGGTTREVEEATGDTVYKYRQPELAAPPKEPPIALTLTPLPGIINTRVRHELRLTESGWKLRTEFSVSPSRTEVESLDIEVPPAFRPSQAEPPEIVEELAAVPAAGPNRQVYRARLTTPKRSSFSFSLEGDYPMPGGPGSASFVLPRLLGAAERSAEVVASAPARFDLRGSVRAWEGNRPGSWPVAMNPDAADAGVRIRATVEKPVAVAELAWRTAASTASAQSDSDVDIDESRIRVVQRLRFRFTGQAPDRVHLRASRPVLGVQLGGGTLEPAGEGWDILMPGQPAKEQEFTLSYSAPLPASDSEIALPLLMVESGEVVHSVRVWTSRAGTLRLADSADWTESATEIIAGRSALPDLVMTARGSVAPPVLTFRPSAGGVDGGLNVERARIEVALNDADAGYRCQYWIRDWRTDAELVLPAGVRAVEVFVRGKKLPVAPEASGGTPVRVALKRPAGVPAMTQVEVRYRGAARHLEAPNFAREPVVDSMTWAITAQPESLALVAGESSGAWSAGAFLNVFGLGFRDLPSVDPSGSGDVTVRRAGVREVTVLQATRTVWVVGWSIAALALCLMAALAGRGARLTLAAVGVVGFVIGVFLFPQPMALAVFAAVPGLLGFVVLVSSYRWMRLRYRRRVAKVVGFARPGSSLVRPSAAPSSRARDSANRAITPAPLPAPSSS